MALDTFVSIGNWDYQKPWAFRPETTGMVKKERQFGSLATYYIHNTK